VKKYAGIIIVAILFGGGAIWAGFFIKANGKDRKEKPKVVNFDQVKDEFKSDVAKNKSGQIKVESFYLTNQDGEGFGSERVKGKVYVADFFFTTCGTICPRMSHQLERVQKEMKSYKNFQIVSFSIWPEQDTVQALKAYAELHGANPGQWNFLTGKREDIYRLARNSFFTLKPAALDEIGDAGSEFIHTDNFVLVDQEGFVRGFFNGTKPEEVDKMLGEAKLLLN